MIIYMVGLIRVSGEMIKRLLYSIPVFLTIQYLFLRSGFLSHVTINKLLENYLIPCHAKNKQNFSSYLKQTAMVNLRRITNYKLM